MGATNFGNLAVGRYKNASDAYNKLVEDAEYEDGHDAYNGTISTTDGFRTSNDNPRYGTKSFNKWEDKMIDDMSKYDCLCVEITGAVLKRLKESNGYKGKKNVKAFYFFGWASC
tara:strand:- start:804 stop:1145 length:342 start_codon:yes stop_codon:yes gene_type:complete